MKTYAIVLIVFGCVAIAILFLCCLCYIGRKKKRPVVAKTIYTPRPPQPVHRDVEKGDISTSSSGLKDGGMVVLGAGAAVAATVATAASNTPQPAVSYPTSGITLQYVQHIPSGPHLCGPFYPPPGFLSTSFAAQQFPQTSPQQWSAPLSPSTQPRLLPSPSPILYGQVPSAIPSPEAA
ncbi:hypothetical protein BUALT_Bualt03G0173700 [Buddleja alternifolia]|uniref:Uncharacterized protein n=1 Tax=Buddleja alternifolia TaxID=168488 RepID=A0AAV6XYY0_9LAMI|nr:hypothetical protein BUALT_Bualt03G0173700 [Buddleja alternifolia]